MARSGWRVATEGIVITKAVHQMVVAPLHAEHCLQIRLRALFLRLFAVGKCLFDQESDSFALLTFFDEVLL